MADYRLGQLSCAHILKYLVCVANPGPPQKQEGTHTQRLRDSDKWKNLHKSKPRLKVVSLWTLVLCENPQSC